MKSKYAGANTSPEVTNVSKHGLWVLWSDSEFFLDYVKFPWFKDATIAQATNVIAESETHLYWPDLDVDLSLRILQNPDAYPLLGKR